MTAPVPAPLGARRQMWETLRLGVPVMIARSGLLMMVTADVIMTGWAGADELAFYALALAPMQALFVMGLGALSGILVLTPQADGLGVPERCGSVWRVSLIHALLLGTGFGLLALTSESFFLVIGQEAALSAGGATVARAMAVGMPGLLLYIATAMYLEGISRPRANMVLMVAANLANVGLNWLLIYDHGWTLWGTDSGGMGASGAALGTSLVRWAMFLALAVYALLMRGAVKFGARGPLLYALDFDRKLRRLGFPLALAQGLESSVFTAMVMMAGWLGTLPLAAYQIVNNLFTLVYMLAIGLGTATNVRVGNAVGARDAPGVRAAGWSGIGLAFVLLSVMCAVFLTVPGLLTSAYTADPAVRALAIPLLMLGGGFLIFDGGQGVLVGALRGTGDIWIPSTFVVSGFLGVSVPVGYLLAFSQGLGVLGLMWGLLLGALAASSLLLLRFRSVSRRELRAL